MIWEELFSFRPNRETTATVSFPRLHAFHFLSSSPSSLASLCGLLSLTTIPVKLLNGRKRRQQTSVFVTALTAQTEPLLNLLDSIHFIIWQRIGPEREGML